MRQPTVSACPLLRIRWEKFKEIKLKILAYFSRMCCCHRVCICHYSPRLKRIIVNPQGSITGCLLFLIYINDLPSCLSVGSPRMFADDTNITFVAGTTSELESLINIELQSLNQWLLANRLSLNIAKTEFMIISSRQKQLTNTNNHINIKLENNHIKRVASAKSLSMSVSPGTNTLTKNRCS